MGRMNAVNMEICDMYADGMDQSEIAEVLSLQYDIDLDSAYILIYEALDLDELD